jgi:hypothetical protein
VHIAHYTEAGPREPGTVMTVEFELTGQRFTGIDGRPEFTFDEAVSFQITVEDQDELDHFWEKLSEGGSEGPCGWLKDKCELSWQVVPAGMEDCSSIPTRRGPGGRWNRRGRRRRRVRPRPRPADDHPGQPRWRRLRARPSRCGGIVSASAS